MFFFLSVYINCRRLFAAKVFRVLLLRILIPLDCFNFYLYVSGFVVAIAVVAGVCVCVFICARSSQQQFSKRECFYAISLDKRANASQIKSENKMK